MSLLETPCCCLLLFHCTPLKSNGIGLPHESPTPSDSGRKHLGFPHVFTLEHQRGTPFPAGLCEEGASSSAEMD